ncbi:MAG: chalcone isomerase family protein [Thiomonas sp.]|uniref:chalcone isomerase family protein n=1 Tax=Thiomonas sp. TaxID=2047785 RepID=UPI002A35A780|nr:chalcone isomerase family protein [Thiomonas sp.]MDY0331296.1 chalcone isomerase family protein [Thiomonas sp.]
MKNVLTATAIALAAAFGAASAHAAVKVGGVPVMQTAPANGVPLLINGAGVVNMGGKMAAAVYLPQNTTSASSIMTMPGAKSIRLTALSNMSAEAFAKALESGVKKGVSAAQYASFKPAMDAFSKQLASIKQIPRGETVELLFEPSNGIVLMGPGSHIIPGTGNAELYQAMLRMLPAGVLSNQSIQNQNING